MTIKQLESMCKTWQKRLRIQDWDIELEVLNRKQMIDRTDSDVLGACHCYPTKKKANIVLLTPSDTNPNEDDIEVILVHEMLHVVMPVQDLKIKIDDNDQTYITYERIVDQLARSLVGAYRG